MAICWERADLLLFSVLIVCVPLPFGVWGRMWKMWTCGPSTVLVPNHCLFIYFVLSEIRVIPLGVVGRFVLLLWHSLSISFRTYLVFSESTITIFRVT